MARRPPASTMMRRDLRPPAQARQPPAEQRTGRPGALHRQPAIGSATPRLEVGCVPALRWSLRLCEDARLGSGEAMQASGITQCGWPSLALATQPVALAVEPVRAGWQDGEVAAVDLIAIQVRWRWWDTEIRVRGVTVLRRRPSGRRPRPAGRGRRRPGSPRRGRRRSNGRGGRRLQRPVIAGHDALALAPPRLVGDLLALGRPHGTLRHLGDRPDFWLGSGWLAPANATPSWTLRRSTDWRQQRYVRLGLAKSTEDYD